MGFTTQLLVVGPIRPGTARPGIPRAGRSRPGTRWRATCPSCRVESIGTAEVGHSGHPSDDDQVWVSTFGPTTVFGGELEQNGLAGRIGKAVPAGEGWWQLTVHSAVDLCRLEVREPGDGQDREPSVSGEDTRESAEALALGDPLPKGDVQRGLGDLSGVDDVAMHGFRLAPSPDSGSPDSGPPDSGSADSGSAGPQRPWWRRLFRSPAGR